jgi:hypothetical protein
VIFARIRPPRQAAIAVGLKRICAICVVVVTGAALPFGTAEPAPIRSALQKTRARARENDFIQTYVFFCVYGFDFANDKTV